MGWYKFTEGESVGRIRVNEMHIAWYDMEHNGLCYNEDIVSFNENDSNTDILEEIGRRLPYTEIPHEKKCDKSRVFLYFDNGEEYELTLRKIEKNENTSRFASEED